MVVKPKYPLDWHAEALHLGAFVDGTLVGICSIYPENPQEQVDSSTYRIRSLATLIKYRGRGIGRCLIEECIAHAKRKGARFIWCNARGKAAPFYAKCGFIKEGNPLSLPGVGPHFFFKKQL